MRHRLSGTSSLWCFDFEMSSGCPLPDFYAYTSSSDIATADVEVSETCPCFEHTQRMKPSQQQDKLLKKTCLLARSPDIRVVTSQVPGNCETLPPSCGCSSECTCSISADSTWLAGTTAFRRSICSICCCLLSWGTTHLTSSKVPTRLENGGNPVCCPLPPS